LTYQIGFDSWRWAVGTGVYVDDIMAQVTRVAWQFFSIAMVAGMLLTLCAHLFSRRIIVEIECALLRPAAFEMRIMGSLANFA
jgi:methyl-accepting chemotaxis protein